MSDELTQKIADVEKKLNETRQHLSVLEVENHRIKREMHELEGKKMDVGINIRKARLLIGELQTIISALTRQYWENKGK